MQPQYNTGTGAAIADQINLYCQKTTMNVSLASWETATTNNGGEFN